MKTLFIVIFALPIASTLFAQTFEARNINLMSGATPDLEAYQANLKGFEWTVKNGSSVINLSGKTPFMYWYQEPFSAAIVTAQISIVSATGGTFRATFHPSDLNPSFLTNAVGGITNLRYGIGVSYSGGDMSVRHGRMRLIADPIAAGAIGETFYTTNVNWSLINWSGLPDFVVDAPSDDLIYARSNGEWVILSAIPSTADVSTALSWAQSGSNIAYSASTNAEAARQIATNALAQQSGNSTSALFRVTGAGRLSVSGEYGPTAAISFDVTGLATGTPLYVEAGTGTLVAASLAGYATGTPLYVETGTGTLVAASLAGYATGTPLYVETGTGTLVSASLSPLEDGLGNVSGRVVTLELQLPVVSNIAVTSSNLAELVRQQAQAGSNLAATANALATTANATGTAAHALAAEASALAGTASTTLSNTSFAVNGQNITGRWFAVNNNVGGFRSFVGGGASNSAAGTYSFIGGGNFNEANGDVSVVVGGFENKSYSAGFVGGGNNNTATGSSSAIVGGSANSAIGDLSAIVGGAENSADGYSSFIGGGVENETIGNQATIPGGYNNTATTNAFAAGIGAKATNSGSFVLSAPGTTNSTFGSIGDNSFAGRFVGGVYFLAPDFWIQDTNGNAIARFSGTNTTISGSLNLTGYATTQQLHIVNTGKLDAATAATTYSTTNTVGTLRTQFDGVSNAVSIQATGKQDKATAAATYATTTRVEEVWSILNTGRYTTAAGLATSNSLNARISIVETGMASKVSVDALGNYATNNRAATWSGNAATQTVPFATNGASGVSYIDFTFDGAPDSLSRGIAFYNGYPVFASGTGRYPFYGPWNFSPASYLSVAAAQAGYFRFTSTYPTGTTSAGSAYQVAFTNANSTNWIAFYIPGQGWNEAALRSIGIK